MWDDLAAWFQSPGGARVLQTAIIPALAILVAGLLAAAIARSAVKATIRRAERVEAATVVAALVAAAQLTADAGDDTASRRRAARLRTEVDVRARLLPLPGAELAADWAAERTGALQRRSADGPPTAELAELRDRLVEWVGKPSRARRLFAAPIARAAAPAAAAGTAPRPEAESSAAPAAPPAPAAEQPTEPREPDRFARPAVAPGPRRTPPEPDAATAAAEPEPEPDRELVGASAAAPAPAVAAAPIPAAGENLPAWQRTRAVERLQQERSRGRAVEPATSSTEEEPVPVGTAPVALPHPHRADATAAAADAEEAVRLEAHQQARHARPAEQASTGAIPAATPTPAPAWLDTYDDEAQVTQNLDLKTPPPVAASAVRDRGAPGEDLVPRT